VFNTDPNSHGAYRQFDIPIEVVNLTDHDTDFGEPPGIEYDVVEWPSEAIAWRIKAGLDQETCVAMGIGYDPSTHRIYLPTWDTLYETDDHGEPELVGYQLRRLTDRGPKYLTAVKDREHQPSTLMLPGTPTKVDQQHIAVLVEDLASGTAIARACINSEYHAEVVVNYGTKVTPEVLARCTHYNKGLVWLDNDSDHVADQAHKIAKVWRLLSGSYVAIESERSDPKHLSEGDILNALAEHMNG